jgi:hypothetical protein
MPLELLSTDRRRLGVCVERLVLRDDHLRIEVMHAHPSLCEGFTKPRMSTPERNCIGRPE